VTGGAQVVVANLTTGDSRTTTAGEDGSFEVILAGSTADDYEIVVTSGGQSSSVVVGPGGGGASLADSLLDRRFLLESADGYTPVPNTTISVSFDADGFGFSAGCNGHFGDYTLCGARLCIEGLGSTEIGCDQERSTQDSWLATFFTSEPAIDLSGAELTFTGDVATLVFLDREVANPDRPLTGRTWTVDTFIDGDAASNLALEISPTLDFSDDGTLSVFSGCNDVVFDYDLAGQAITLSLVSSTRAACTGAAGEASGHVSAVLTGAVNYEIDAQRLTLMNGDLGLGATTD
jgi:heat shock protein HslJ